MNRIERREDVQGRTAEEEHGQRSVVAFVFEDGAVPDSVALHDAAEALSAAAKESVEIVKPAQVDDGHDFFLFMRDAARSDSMTAFSSDYASTFHLVQAFKADIADGKIVAVAQIVRSVAQQPARILAADAAGLLVKQLSQSIGALAPSLTTKEGPAVSPQVAYALAEEEQDLRAIEDEFGWLDSGDVAEQLGKRRSRTLASSLRAKGQILGYVRRGQQAVRFPKFQFDGMGILPVVPELIRVANERGVAHEDLIFWLCAPTGMLPEDARPVDMLLSHPQEVLAAAQHDLGGRSW